MKSISILALSVLLGSASAANALTTVTDPVTLEPDYTFTGTANLSFAGILNATGCTLTLTGEIDIDSTTGDATITVTSGSSSGSFSCNLVDLRLSQSPWVANIPQADLPNPRFSSFANGTFTGLDIRAAGVPCGGSSAPAIYTNGDFAGDPSKFIFSTTVGFCSVDGELSVVGNDVDVWTTP